MSNVRDDKTYTVRKLADGNCWMTSNLGTEIAEGKIFSSSSTNLTTKDTWTVSASQKAGYYHDDTYGGHYNWMAATAGTGTYQTASGVTIEDSICPKGWRLPPSSGTKSFAYLFSTAYVSSARTTKLASPFDMLLGGLGFEGDLTYYSQGTTGRYWTSTAASASDNWAYALVADSSSNAYTTER